MPVSLREGDALLMLCSGLESQNIEEGVVVHSNGLSRGDRRRNERLARLRELVPVSNLILAVDLADEKQVFVLTDHDSRVLARRRVRAKVWRLGPVLDWAIDMAAEFGAAGVTVGCEPTGHRWRMLDQLAAERAMPLVCVQPLLVGRAREREDYTRDKRDDKDAVLIAGLVGQLHCYLPERPDHTWARLRHLGARRQRLVVEATGCVQQLRDLLECCWPAVLNAAAKPFDSTSWLASLAVVLDRCDGCPQRLHRLGPDRFRAAAVREVRRWGGQRVWRPITNRVFAALTDPAGVTVQRPGGLERAGFLLADLRSARARLGEVEALMREVLDELDLTDLVTSIDGLSALGAAAILAETGDPSRFDSARALVKHAGLAPRENSSGNRQGQARLTGRGRGLLRLAAWRAVWGALPNNPVMAARFQHLTTRSDNPLSVGQARASLAASLLRWLHVVITKHTRWDPAVAAGLTDVPEAA